MSEILRIFKEIDQHLNEDTQPSLFLNNENLALIFLETPFTIFGDMKKTMQSPVHHPEGNVWNHTMLVVDIAVKYKTRSTDDRAFMWAALLHDIGKPSTTRIRKEKITSYDHEAIGAEMASTFLNEFNENNYFIKKVSALIRWHMQILFVVKSLIYADIKRMKEQTDIQDIVNGVSKKINAKFSLFKNKDGCVSSLRC